jgi:diaminopimelate decarboxylase
MEEFRFQESELWCEESRVAEVAARFGTPLYVYSRRSVVDHCRHIERAFGSIDHLSCYAIKANANRHLLRLLAAEGIGADAGSIGEMQCALSAGFDPSLVTFSGVGKSDDEIEFAIRRKIRAINVESEEELRIVSGIAGRCDMTAPVLLRVNFDIESGTHPYITTGRRQNKFGIPRSIAPELFAEALRLRNINVLGVHSHIGSQITDAETFVGAAGTIVEFIAGLRSAGIPVSELNFGGGFGVQYRDYVRHPQLPADEKNPEANVTTVGLLQAALPVLRSSGCRILIQPGRSIIAHAGILVTRVLYRKKGEERMFIIVDAGMNDLIRPSLYQSYHQVVPVLLAGRAPEVVDVVGPLCETGDYFALNRALPGAGRGDLLALMCTGAYGYVLSSNYNGRPRPAEVLVDGNTSRVIREREQFCHEEESRDANV